MPVKLATAKSLRAAVDAFRASGSRQFADFANLADALALFADDVLADEAPPPRPGHKTIHQFETGEAIVSMAKFRNRIFVATNLGVYEVENDKLSRLKFEAVP